MINNTKKIFSERIRSLRKEKGYTQKKIADMLNLTASAIGGYENEERLPRAQKIKEIANIFNVSIDYLLGRTNKKDEIDNIIKTHKENQDMYQIWLKILKNDIYIDVYN